MAGVVPSNSTTKVRRKTWTIHEGPGSTLRLLQGRLAEEGCPDAQTAIARNLLEENQDSDDNRCMAVYWLIKASEQGHITATEMLKRCLEEGKGITEQNILDVKNCLTMPHDEKLAKTAARQLFFNLSAGHDYITTEQLRKKINFLEPDSGDELLEKAIAASPQKARVSPENFTVDDWHETVKDKHHAGEKLSEDYMISAASTYVRGELPLVQRVLVLADPERGKLERIGFMQRSVIYPMGSVKFLYVRLLEFFARNGSHLCLMLFPTSPIHTILLLLCYWIAGADSLFWLITIFLFFTSFAFMFFSTLEILQKEREFNHFHGWSQLFLSYGRRAEDSGGSINSRSAESRFLKNGIKSSGKYFIALLIHIIIHPLVSSNFIPYSELTILSVFSSIIILFSFMDSFKRPDPLMLFSFALNVLARYPYEFDSVVQSWEFLDLKAPVFASVVVGRGVEFCLTYRGLLHLAVAITLFIMAFRDGWRGVFRSLIPHCVALSWWQVAVLCAESSTTFGLLRAAFCFVGLALCIPLLGLLLLLLPAFAAARNLSDINTFVKTIIIFFMVAVPIAVAIWLTKIYRRGRVVASKYILMMQIICGILAISLLFPMKGLPSTYNSILSRPTSSSSNTATPQHSTNAPNNGLTWKQYHQLCHQPAWEKSSMVKTQITCAPLIGQYVNWEGYVSDVEITMIWNPISSILYYIPMSIASYIKCVFGEEISNDNVLRNIIEHERCDIENWSTYNIELSINMKSLTWGTGSVNLKLIAGHAFKNFTSELRQGDRIWFNAYLMTNGPIPKLQLEQLGCLSCHKTDLSVQRKPFIIPINFPSFLDLCYAVIQSALLFFLGPIVRFT